MSVSIMLDGDVLIDLPEDRVRLSAETWNEVVKFVAERQAATSARK